MDNVVLLKKLSDWGCDTIGALNRMMGDENFLIECIISVNQDESFEQLGKAIKAKNNETAFSAAHNLKGISANTGITPMYAITSKIVELIRNGETSDLKEYYDKLIEKNSELSQILNG